MATFSWKTDTEILKEIKKGKKQELNQYCQEDIEYGFLIEKDNNTYRISYDKEGQNNIQDVLRLFDNEMITEYTMTAHTEEDDEEKRIVLTKDEFINLHQESVRQRERKISKLRDVLNPLIDSLENKQGINEVSWEETYVLNEEPIDISLNQENRLDKQVANLRDTFDILLPKEEDN